MQIPMYNSSIKIYSAEEQDRKRRKEPSPLAQATFEAFRPFINVLDCGFEFLDRPLHLISKEDWQLYRRHKAGERGLRYSDGTKFNPYLHVIQSIFGPKHIHGHIAENELTYYTSGQRRLGLLYLDIDAHHRWQTDALRARRILERLFPSAYFRPSRRGQNGYLKVRYSSISEFNDLADKLQAALQQLFLHLGILCDIEIKGTITHGDKSGRLAKLPFTNKKNTQDASDCWGFEQLEKFIACPVLNVRRIAVISDMIMANVDEERMAKCQQQKQRFIQRDKARATLVAKLREYGWSGPDDAIWQRFKKLRDEQRASGEVGVRIPVLNGAVSSPKVVSGKTPKRLSRSSKIAAPSSPGQCDGDAFQRNLNDLLPFVRGFFKRHRRFPDLEDALLHLRDNRLFSGEWEDNESRRAKRVGQILSFLESGFDPKLLSNGQSQPVILSRSKFAWWVRQRYGSGLKAQTVDLKQFDPVTMTAPVKEVVVPAEFVETFLAVADFCVNVDPLENKAVPTNRIKKLWGMVTGGASWNQKYYQIVRDRLDKAGVLNIFDRYHDDGKAWKWDSGKRFPSESWRKEQEKLNQLYHGRVGDSFEQFLAGSNGDENNNRHNTLYQTRCPIEEISAPRATSRPPPDW